MGYNCLRYMKTFTCYLVCAFAFVFCGVCSFVYADEAAPAIKKRSKAFDGVREQVKKDLLDKGIGEQDYEAKMNEVIDCTTPQDRTLAKMLIMAGVDVEKNGADWWQRSYKHPDVTSLLALAGVPNEARVKPGQSNKTTANDTANKVSVADDKEDDDSDIAPDKSEDDKTVNIIKGLKKVSGKPDEDAKAYAFIVMTELFVSNMFSEVGAYEKPEKHFRKIGVVKQLQSLQKKKDVETILAVEEGADMKAVRTKLMKWLGIKAPIVQWNTANISEIAGCDGVYVVDRKSVGISQGTLEDGESMAEMMKTLNAWLKKHAE